MRVKKISLFVHDLAANPIGRAYPIAKALKKIGFEVEIIGFLITGDKIYSPYNDTFNYLTLRADSRPRTIFKAADLARKASGDIIYAFKPLWTSYWPALLASGFGRKKPLLLDIEDNELILQGNSAADLIYKNFIRGWNFIISPKYNWILHPLTRLAAHKTVSTTALQRIYGGEIILHGPDSSLFDPTRSNCDKSACRRKFNLPQSSPLLLFAGTPYPHKGLDSLVRALTQPQLSSFHLVLCGNAKWEEYVYALNALGQRCHMIDFLPNSSMPELLAAVDIVPVLQRQGKFSSAQLPVKMLDAMAMGKAIIATAVSDMPSIIGANPARGWIIPSLDEKAFITAALEIINNPDEARGRGDNARRYFLDNASLSANTDKMRGIMNKLNINISS